EHFDEHFNTKRLYKSQLYFLYEMKQIVKVFWRHTILTINTVRYVEQFFIRGTSGEEQFTSPEEKQTPKTYKKLEQISKFMNY
ncbi:MAG: hypothetical protein ACTS40_02195, partial [Candidatus Hodgkinia cicadicola]